MLSKVITGGQSGVDQAAWRAAKWAGIKTGGNMIHGFLTADGKRPWFAHEFGAVERPVIQDISRAFGDRTRANVAESQFLLLVVTDISTTGSKCALDACRRYGRRKEIIKLPHVEPVRWVDEFIASERFDNLTRLLSDPLGTGEPYTLMVGGNRGHHLDLPAERLLRAVFSHIAARQTAEVAVAEALLSVGGAS